MYALQVMIGMLVLRIILPIAVLLIVGEWVRNHEQRRQGWR